MNEWESERLSDWINPHCKEPSGMSSPSRWTSLSSLQVTRENGPVSAGFPSVMEYWEEFGDGSWWLTLVCVCACLCVCVGGGVRFLVALASVFCFSIRGNALLRKDIQISLSHSLFFFPDLLNTFSSSYFHRGKPSRLPEAVPQVLFLPRSCKASSPRASVGQKQGPFASIQRS